MMPGALHCRVPPAIPTVQLQKDALQYRERKRKKDQNPRDGQEENNPWKLLVPRLAYLRGGSGPVARHVVLLDKKLLLLLLLLLRLVVSSCDASHVVDNLRVAEIHL